MKIKEYIFSRIQKYNPRTPRYQSYATARSIFLLFESDTAERNLQIKTLVKQLKEDGKEVTAWGYVDKKQAESAVLRDYRILSQFDYDFWGLPKKEIRQELKVKRYDLLIDLNMSGCLPLKYLSLYAEADFRTGIESSEPYLNDLMINIKEENNPAFLFDQIIHYLNTIQTC